MAQPQRIQLRPSYEAYFSGNEPYVPKILKMSLSEENNYKTEIRSEKLQLKNLTVFIFSSGNILL